MVYMTNAAGWSARPLILLWISLGENQTGFLFFLNFFSMMATVFLSNL